MFRRPTISVFLDLIMSFDSVVRSVLGDASSNGWKMDRGFQSMTWQKSIENVNSGLAREIALRLLDWDP